LHTWAPNDEWNVDIFVESAFLAGIEAMLGDMVTIVCGIDDKRVVKNLGLFETCD